LPYTVKEIFLSLQGEGAQAGRAAVFLRFTGCNLWTGREADRARSRAACSAWCDTDFVGTDGQGGGSYRSSGELAQAVSRAWGASLHRRFVVCTGGEPLLQLDSALVDALHAHGFEIAVETNGTQVPPAGVDWITVSPKHGADLVLNHGSELKLAFPQPGLDPKRFEDGDFAFFFVQPIDGPDRQRNAAAAVRFCLENPRWRLSVQVHKLVGLQ
jgi:7-carboxy-7-deazaguanine synthase (Cx14CxxC type)